MRVCVRVLVWIWTAVPHKGGAFKPQSTPISHFSDLKKNNHLYLEGEKKSFSMIIFCFLSIWMERISKMGYFNGRCIFYNIYISRVVETYWVPCVYKFKKKNISNVNYTSIIMIDHSIVWYYSSEAYLPIESSTCGNEMCFSSVWVLGRVHRVYNWQVWLPGVILLRLTVYLSRGSDIYCCIPPVFPL